MAIIKVPGIYMVRNKLNGKIYIGQSGNIKNRWRQHRSTANSKKPLPETATVFMRALREFGIDNFEFILIQTTLGLTTAERVVWEDYYIARYRSDEEEYGYNQKRKMPQFLLERAHCRHTIAERLSRSKMLFEYDIEMGDAMLFFGGAKSWGDQQNPPVGKDIASHTVNRGSLVNNRYYLIYADKDMRDEQLELIRRKKIEPYTTGRAAVRARNAFEKYKAAVDAVDRIARERYGFT